MIPLRLGEIARAVGGVMRGDPDLVVAEVVTDSRRMRDESLFIALRGEQRDGHDHVREALGTGAVAYVGEREVVEGADAVLVEDTWAAIGQLGRAVRDRVGPAVVALTGSVGKTTTKDLAAAALGAGKRTVAAPGSYNNELGVPLTLLAVEADTEALVVEVGSRGVGHIAALMPLVRPDVAIVTAVSGAHLEMFGDLETVALAKGELVEALDADGTAILNADDARVLAMADRARGTVVTYGTRDRVAVGGSGRDVDVVATNVAVDRLARASFDVRTPWGDARVTLPLAGAHHVHNALAALAAAGVLGVAVDAAAAALDGARVSAWRSDVAEADRVVVLNDAYNANPASMAAALQALVEIERDGQAWAVLGVMAELGEVATEEHERLGRRCAELDVDRVVVVGAEAEGIAAGALEAGMPAERLSVVADADKALEVVRDGVGPGDVVLVKGSRVAGLEKVAAAIIEDRREGAA